MVPTVTIVQAGGGGSYASPNAADFRDKKFNVTALRNERGCVNALCKFKML